MASADLKDTFLALREQCVWIQTCFNTNKDLFGSGRARLKLLEDSAHAFFLELNRILIENFVLQVCAITDPPMTRVGKELRSNLTVRHLNKLLDAESLLTAKIEDAAAGIAMYRSIIAPARDKLIAHRDKETVLSYVTMGKHTVEDVEKFFENLYAYVNEVGRSIGMDPLDFKTTSGPGDVNDLFRALNGGVYPV